MNICIGRPLLARSLILIVAAVLGLAPLAWGAGTVTNATQTDLQAALVGGGTVTFGVGGVITLTNTIIIAQDTVLDANGFEVTISGGNAVRLFQVNSNVALSVNGLTLANGRFVGTNGADGSPAQVGGDGLGAGILNLGGVVALTGCALTNHFAQGGSSGIDTTPNLGTYAPGGNGSGAALCNLGGTLNLTNCLLAGNSTLGGTSSDPMDFHALTSTGYAIGGGALGGAIYSANGQVHLEGVTFASNRSTGGPRSMTTSGYLAGTAGEAFGGAIYVTNSELVLSGAALEGNSADGGCTDGLGGALFLDQASSSLIRLSRFTGNAANGIQSDFYNFPGGNASGGGVFNAGALQISGSTFSSNSCTAGGGNLPGAASGGAICSTNGLVINGSTFDDNQAVGGNASGPGGLEAEPRAPGEGGAIWSSGALAATNSTWATNQAVGGACAPVYFGTAPGGAGSGGAVCITGGQAVYVNVTIAANRGEGTSNILGAAPGPSQGGGLYNTNGVVTVINSIIADSLSGGDVWGAVTDGGHNICSDGTAGFSATGSLNSTNPLVGPLAANGGPTLTMSLLSGSPALDAIPSGFPPVDQRGVPRPQGPLADIGAFETLAGTAGGPLGITLLPGNSLAIQFLGVPGTTYSVQASTDLVHWTGIGVATSGTNSEFQFIDTGTNASAARFYRTRVP